MGFLDYFRRVPQAQPQASKPQRVKARIDIAEQSDDYKHWANADWFSLDGALTAVKRRTMRDRARYERLNNSYLAGITETLAADLIGTGPRLQINTGDQAADRAVERAFCRWGHRIGLASKLRTMRQSRLIDGEAFAQFVTNPALDGVQLDIRLIEAEMIATPIGLYIPNTTPEGSIVDGLEFDEFGNVIAYKRLKYHPGSNFMISNFEFDRIEAKFVIHWFKQIRPAQHRGLSEVAPALRLFGSMRRFTDAVIAAAETAADFAAFLHTNSPAAEVDEVDGGAFQSMDIQKRSIVTLPSGYDISQLKAEQPTSTYSMFKREILNEIGRSVGLPYNMTALDSSGYNYASGRMDHALYHEMIRTERDELRHTALDRIFLAWCDEAIPLGLIPGGMPPISEWDWEWAWDGREHVDPSKEANAQETRLRTHTTTLAHEYGKQGKDWQVELAQRAKEIALMRDLNLIVDLSPEATYQDAQTADAEDAEDSDE